MKTKRRVGKSADAQETVRVRGVRIFRRAWLRLFSPRFDHPRIGLVLSSGGAKSLAHVGVIQVFEENNIPIHAIAGSSMGAYVGALWAAGCHGGRLEDLAAEMHDKKVLRKLADPAFPFLKGLIKGEKAKEHLRQTIGDVTFDDLDRELVVIAADLDSDERVVLRQGSVVDAIHASCAMPGIVVPVTIGGRRCVDGGVVEPVPVGALKRFCDVDIVIAVNTLPSFAELAEEEGDGDGDPMFDPGSQQGIWGHLKKGVNSMVNLAAYGNTIDTLRRSIRIAQIRMAYDSCKRADIVIHAHSRPESQWHDYQNYRQFVDIGREVAEQCLPKIRELIGSLQRPTNKHEIQSEQMVG
jgi:NTE family protein